MKRKLLFFSFFTMSTMVLLSFFGGCFWKTNATTFTEIDSLSQIVDELEHADDQTLIVFDVAETLITYKDSMLQPRFANNPKLKQFNKEFHKVFITPESLDKITDKLETSAAFITCEKETAQIIKRIQDSGKRVIALTRYSHKLSRLRDKQLKECGINFESSFFPEEILFQELSQGAQIHPIFYHGLLLTGSLQKGPVLAAFLDHVQFRPSRVIMIDNDKKYLISVADAMKSKDIPFKGYHYCGADKMPDTWDDGVIQFQHNYLLKYHKWIGEDAAREKIQKK